MKNVYIVLFILIGKCIAWGQQNDTTIIQPKLKTTIFSGSVGLTNNAFSIIPTFSLNSPATLTWLSWQKKRWSFDPDIRLSLDARKGSMVFWLRYQVINKKAFKLRIGAHPAFNIQLRQILTNGSTSEISQLRRFIASEIVPEYQINPRWKIGIYYLQGNGLQKDGPVTSHFVNLNTTFSNIKVGNKMKMAIIPAIYYLNLDGYEGNYFTATGRINHNVFPIFLQGSINKTITSNLPGNKDFLWSISLHYHFRKEFIRVEKK